MVLKGKNERIKAILFEKHKHKIDKVEYKYLIFLDEKYIKKRKTDEIAKIYQLTVRETNNAITAAIKILTKIK